MKFGKYLASRQLELPEYSGHFIDYKSLKKLIKQLAIPKNNSLTTGSNYETSITEIQQTLKENKASFFFRVERELDKVNSFYLEKQANLSITLNLLLMKKNEIFTKANEYLKHNDIEHGGSDSQMISNFNNSISFMNLYQNFKKIHQDLIRLQQFIELNETGFSKVVKKWDKRSKSHTKELFISTAVSVQPVFHKNEINELSDLVTQSLFDIESMMDGDYSCLNNYTELRQLQQQQQQLQQQQQQQQQQKEEEPDRVSSPNESPIFQRHSSITASISNNNEIDELYSSFVNIATIKDPDTSLLTRWVDKINGSHKQSENFTPDARVKVSKIFLLSISNLKISDQFLQTFLQLINFDIDFEFTNNDLNNNKTILHECCSIPIINHNETNVIINNGVKVVNQDIINHTRFFIVKYIIENMKNNHDLLICKDFNGRICLHYASQNNRSDLLSLILPVFPTNHIDDLDNESMSPLLLAIKHGNLNIIQNLVQYGSNPFPEAKKEKLQYLPINYACKFGDYNLLKYLLSSLDKVVDFKVLLNQQDVEGLLPLHVVSRAGHYQLIELLIHHGAEVNKLDGFNKWTPIFYAASEGHVTTTQELIKFGARLNIIDEDGYNVLYYCVVEGHINVINVLLKYQNDMKLDRESTDFSSMAILGDVNEADDSDGEEEDSGSLDKNPNNNNVDIPDLQLPPPILPLRRYGHNFLEQKVLIELIFSTDEEFINLFNLSNDLKPGRITLTSNISDIVPRNILLPIDEEKSNNGKNNNNCVFQTDVESLNEFRIDFEIFPKFGTRLIAKTTALNFSQIDTTSPEINSIQLPLFDLRLRNIGQLKFNYQVIFPFSGALLETSKFDTYWKSSTNFVKAKQSLKLNAAGGLSPNNFLSPNGNTTIPDITPAQQVQGAVSNSSIVTATSLSGEYLRIKICLLNDGTPIVCPHWSISITENIDLYLPNLSLEQLTSITDDLFDYTKVIKDLSSMTIKDILYIKKLLKIIYLPLDIILDILNNDINLNLELVFPSLFELDVLPFNGNLQNNLNNFIDFTLNDVFNHIRTSKETNSRSIIFLSSNSLICKILNWKQPNFPVFLIMNGITYNLKKHEFEKRSTNGLKIGEGEYKKELIDNYQELTIRSIKEAVNFTISNNLIGLITSIHLLNLVPKLIPLIRSRGLILVASSDINEEEDQEILRKELDCYTKTEINGLRFDDVLSFKEDITM